MKRILLTAEEVVAVSGSESSSESVNAFIETLGKMELSEIITKYGEKALWALITVVIGAIIVHWAVKFVMRYVEKSNLASGATKFIHGIVAFLLYFIVILTAANVIGIPVTSVLAIFSVFTLAFSLAIKDIIALFASGISICLTNLSIRFPIRIIHHTVKKPEQLTLHSLCVRNKVKLIASESVNIKINSSVFIGTEVN